MPISESEELTREKLEELRRKNVCAECGGWLNTFLGEGGVAFVACNDWLRTHHEGVEKEARIFEPNIPTRRTEMETEHGEAKTRALAKYVGTAAITKKVATDIVETLWGGAPLIEKTKCILLCQTYQLNPLMKHLYLVGYKRYKDKKLVVDAQGNPILDWSIQIGIGATRLLAQRRHHYSYLDFTPRKATQVEIDKILGDTADPDCIYGFVHIRDRDSGAEAFGLRGIEKNANIKGTEKGNTHLNMACIRAERLALDRQYPGEMPQDVEVVDERFIEGEYQVLDKETGEITGPETKKTPPSSPPSPTQTQKKEHWCEEHNCAFEKKTRGSSTWYAHKLPDNSWCNEAKKKEDTRPEPEPEPEPENSIEENEPEPEPEPAEEKRDPSTLKSLNDLFKACNEDFKLQPDQVIKELGFSSQTDISDTPADCYAKVAAVRR